MVVGLIGKARSGKDTAADCMVELLGFERIAFADPIKEGLKHMMGWTEEHVNGNLKETICPYWGFTPRWALQFVGTDLFRVHIQDDFWIRRAHKKIVDNPDKDYVFSDVRFLNEADYIKRQGLLIRINRDGAEASGGIQDHASEMEMDQIIAKVEISNNHSILDFKQTLLVALAKEKRGW